VGARRLFLRFPAANLCFAAVLTAGSALALQPDTRLTQYAHRAWRFGDAGLYGTPQSIAQTADGYIWVATSYGLLRFDGVRFTPWSPPAGESLPSNSLWYLYGARDGSLYVSTDLGLARIRGGHVHNYPGSPRWPGPFAEDSAGAVWMGVSGSSSEPSPLCRVDQSSLVCIGPTDGLGCVQGLSNAIDPSGFIWVGSAEGICRWKAGASPSTYLLPSVGSQRGRSAIRALAAVSDGSVWAGTSPGKGAGLLRYVGGKWSSYVTPQVDGSKISVSALLAGHEGALWIGTTAQGLLRLRNDSLEHFDVANGLTGNHVLAIFEDHEGGLWVVTPLGIDFFRDYAALSFTSAEGSPDDHARSVAATPDGTVFLGSETLAAWRGHNLARVRDDHGRPLENIQFLFPDSRGNLWIGADDRLFRRADDGALVATRGSPPLGSAYIDYITEDRDRNIWVAVRDSKTRVSSLLEVRGDVVVARFPETIVMEGQNLNALAPDAVGGIWVGGSAHGLFRFHDGFFERADPAVFNDRVENIMAEPDGAIWLVTPHGFIRNGDGRARRLAVESGLPCDSGVNIQDDKRGSKWFYMHCGILRVADREIEGWWNGSSARIHGRFFTAMDGAQPNLFNGSPAETPDSRLWSANGYDFQTIDLNHLPFNAIAPPVMVESLTADGQRVEPRGEIRFPKGARQIEITYTGLSFLIPEKVRFRYRLTGHDADWVDAGARRQAFYNDLAPGRYLFHVIACNNDGVWNMRGAQVAFYLAPAWYQTEMFRAIGLLVVIAIATFIYWYRMQRYAASLRVRFNERLEERTRLARDLHDTLIQTIQGSKLVTDNARGVQGNPPETARALQRLADWLERAMREGRAALEALRLPTMETSDLAAALRRAASDCTTDHSIRIAGSTVGVIRELHPIARDEAYRIGYEAVRNACSHSGATDLRIEVEYKRDLCIRIRDNGCGFDAEGPHLTPAGHFGLAGMRERALRIGAQFSIESSTQDGTVVSLTIPGKVIYEPVQRGLRAWILRRLGLRGTPDAD
jgi:signal transduction histidine kinase/ligand-binding sensor domain-containing protein